MLTDKTASADLSSASYRTNLLSCVEIGDKVYWADDKQSKAQNWDSKYRQMALVGFDT